MGDRAERKPRPGQGTPVADLCFMLGRAYGSYVTLVDAGGMSAEDKAEEKKALVRRANALLAAVNAL